VPTLLNNVRIVDFLADLEGVDLTATFFKGVERLPPAHRLVCTDAALSITRFCQLPSLLGTSDRPFHDLVEEFRHIFTIAVKARLRSTERVGAMLSGGLDSTSVVAIASRLRREDGFLALPVFSALSR
jgi:asparagine synthase (glutamine-hydrolysing)